MIIIKFCSGLGNQLYQYALYFSIKSKFPTEKVLADVSSFDDIEKLNAGNGFSYGFGLTKFFDVKIDIAELKEIKAVNYEIVLPKDIRDILPVNLCRKIIGASRIANLRSKINYKYKDKKRKYIENYPANSYNGRVFSLDEGNDYYLSGLWQNINYFEDIKDGLRESLVYKMPLSQTGEELSSNIKETTSVSIHMRRGDFTNCIYKQTHDICKMDYYEKAIRLIKNNVDEPVFFVFSDDISYCKKVLSGYGLNIVFVSEDYSLRVDEEMRLMSYCKHSIISNSTFSFWSTWLTDNQRKFIVCPRYVTKGLKSWNELSTPEHWIKIDN